MGGVSLGMGSGARRREGQRTRRSRLHASLTRNVSTRTQRALRVRRRPWCSAVLPPLSPTLSAMLSFTAAVTPTITL